MQYVDARSGSGILILVILLLPYCVDIAWYGDFTPTHYAQEKESVKDGKEDGPASEGAALPIAFDHIGSNKPRIAFQAVVGHYGSTFSAAGPPRYLLDFFLASRPPPIS